MIKSKTQGSITIKKNNNFNSSSHMKLEASESNYKCFFCHKKIFAKTIYELSCTNCGSQWVEKLPTKNLKVYNAT